MKTTSSQSTEKAATRDARKAYGKVPSGADRATHKFDAVDVAMPPEYTWAVLPDATFPLKCPSAADATASERNQYVLVANKPPRSWVHFRRRKKELPGGPTHGLLLSEQ